MSVDRYDASVKHLNTVGQVCEFPEAYIPEGHVILRKKATNGPLGEVFCFGQASLGTISQPHLAEGKTKSHLLNDLPGFVFCYYHLI